MKVSVKGSDTVRNEVTFSRSSFYRSLFQSFLDHLLYLPSNARQFLSIIIFTSFTRMSGISSSFYLYIYMIGFLTRPLPKLSQMSSLYLLPEFETHINTFNAWALSSYVYTCENKKTTQ